MPDVLGSVVRNSRCKTVHVPSVLSARPSVQQFVLNKVEQTARLILCVIMRSIKHYRGNIAPELAGLFDERRGRPVNRMEQVSVCVGVGGGMEFGL